MKKNDFLLIAIFLLVAAILWLWSSGSPSEVTEGEVVIYKDGHEFALIPLATEKTVIVEDDDGNRNVIQIQGGRVEMIEATCQDQICVHTRPAQKDEQSIICLPNRVVVEVRSTNKNEIDGVSE